MFQILTVAYQKCHHHNNSDCDRCRTRSSGPACVFFSWVFRSPGIDDGVATFVMHCFLPSNSITRPSPRLEPFTIHEPPVTSGLFFVSSEFFGTSSRDSMRSWLSGALRTALMEWWRMDGIERARGLLESPGCMFPQFLPSQ